jgi:ribosome-associated protein
LRSAVANPGRLFHAESKEMDRTMDEKSKSQVKREMLGLQSLGEQLVGLNPDQIRRIEMPQDLRDAVLFARKLKRGGALRRQLQYIGALMREADPEPIRKAFDDISRGQRAEALLFRKIEQWRDELLEGNDEVQEHILSHFPDADRQRMRRLVLNARREKEENKPPKSSRALFRYLRELSKL